MSESLTPEQLVETVTSRPGYTSVVGTRVLLAEAGCVLPALDKRPDLLQFNGFFYGGIISGLADHRIETKDDGECWQLETVPRWTLA